jgi:hypothetical protein
MRIPAHTILMYIERASAACGVLSKTRAVRLTIGAEEVDGSASCLSLGLGTCSSCTVLWFEAVELEGMIAPRELDWTRGRLWVSVGVRGGRSPLFRSPWTYICANGDNRGFGSDDIIGRSSGM